MFALVKWADENQFSIIALSRVQEPRKEFAMYKAGDMVKATCPRHKGVFGAKIIEIGGKLKFNIYLNFTILL